MKVNLGLLIGAVLAAVAVGLVLPLVRPKSAQDRSPSPVPRRVSDEWDGSKVQPIINDLHDAVQKAVGAGIDDQIPGFGRGDDDYIFQLGGVECSPGVRSIQEAASLLQTRLKQKYGNKLAGFERHDFPPEGEIVLEAVLETKAGPVIIDIPIFKRTSKRVIIYPAYFIKRAAGSDSASARPISWARGGAAGAP